MAVVVAVVVVAVADVLVYNMLLLGVVLWVQVCENLAFGCETLDYNNKRKLKQKQAATTTMCLLCVRQHAKQKQTKGKFQVAN